MPVKSYIYKTLESGQELAADVHFPVQQTKNPAPIAFLTHGGGWTGGCKDEVAQNQFETLLELGFIVVSVNYRLCPTISLYDGPYTDSKDCYSWSKKSMPQLLKDEFSIVVDPCRVVTLGHSAGGNLALLMGTNPEPPLAVLDFYGAKYFKDDIWHTKNPRIPVEPCSQSVREKVFTEIPAPSDFPIHVGPLREDGDVPIDWAKPRLEYLFKSGANGLLLRDVVKDGDYDRVDPATQFTSKFPPTFFIHGEKDSGIPVRLSEQAHNKLKGLGVETVFRSVEGSEHAFDECIAKSDPRFDIIREGFEFLARHALQPLSD